MADETRIGKYMWKILLNFAVLIFVTSCKTPGSLEYVTINKKKWETSSSYRFKIVKDDNFIDSFKGKSKIQLMEILGNPNLTNTSDPNILVYCLDIDVELKYDEKLNKQICCKCKSSFIVFHFSEEEKIYDITTAWVEPLIQK